MKASVPPALITLALLASAGVAGAQSEPAAHHSFNFFQESADSFRVTHDLTVFWDPDAASVPLMGILVPETAEVLGVTGSPDPVKSWYRAGPGSLAVALAGQEDPVPVERIVVDMRLRGSTWSMPLSFRTNATGAAFYVLPGWEPAASEIGPMTLVDEDSFGRARFASATTNEPLQTLSVSVMPPPAKSLFNFYVGASVVVLSILMLALFSLRTRRLAPRREGTPIEHLGELSRRLRTVFAVLLASTFAYFSFGLEEGTLGSTPYYYPWPSLTENVAAQVFNAFSHGLVPPGVSLIVTAPTDAAFVNVEIALFLGILTALPVLVYETAMFLGPALRPTERRAVGAVMFPAVVLFVFGAGFAYYLLLPSMLTFLYAYAGPIGAVQLLRVEDLVSFAVTTMVIFGIAFELPLVMAGLSRFRIVPARTWQKYWRHVVVVIFLVAAVITPDPSVVNQVMVAVPLIVLYGLGLFAARATGSTREKMA